MNSTPRQNKHHDAIASTDLSSSPAPSIPNFRDVGQTMNRLTSASSSSSSSSSNTTSSTGNSHIPVLKEGILFRSARLDDATPHERQSLFRQYNIKTIIDLRSPTELKQQQVKHTIQAHGLDHVDNSEDPTAEEAAAEGEGEEGEEARGVKVEHISLNTPAFLRALTWRLGWADLLRFVGYMSYSKAVGYWRSGSGGDDDEDDDDDDTNGNKTASGQDTANGSAGGAERNVQGQVYYREQAIRILGRRVLAPRGLIGLGQDTLDFAGDGIQRVFEVLGRRHISDSDAAHGMCDTAESDDEGEGARGRGVFPVLLHCTQGKDRTGLIVLLLLLLLLRAPAPPSPSIPPSSSSSSSSPQPSSLPADSTHNAQLYAKAVADEYLLSSPSAHAAKPGETLGAYVREIERMGMPASFAECPATFTAAITTYLDERYGGVETYLLRHCSVSGECIARIRRHLSA